MRTALSLGFARCVYLLFPTRGGDGSWQLYLDCKFMSSESAAPSAAVRSAADRLIAVVVAASVLLIAATSLLGWLLDIATLKSISAHGPALKPNGVVCLVASAVSLMLAVFVPRARVGQACLGLAVWGFGCAVLLEYALGADFGIDNLVFRDPSVILPGRPPIAGAAAFAALGLSMAILAARQAWLSVLRGALALAVIVAGFAQLLAYFASPIDPAVTRTLFHVPLPGTVAIILLGFGILATDRSNHGVAEVVSVVVPILGLAAMAVLVGVTLYSINHQRRLRDQAHDAEITAVALDRLLNLLGDAETGQRGYLLTGNEAYLRPYALAAPKIAPEIARMAALAGDAEAHEEMKRIQSLAEGELDELRRTIDLKHGGDATAALAIVESDVGERQMGQLRQEIAQMEDVSAKKAESLSAGADRILSWLLYSTLIALSVAAALGGVQMFDTRRRVVGMLRTNQSLAATNKELDRRVEERTQELSVALETARSELSLRSEAEDALRKNVTAIVEGREALARAKAEAERANVAKSKFLAAASHDLRQPVQSLVLQMAVAEHQIVDNPRALETLGKMRGSLEGLNGLLGAILDISWLDAGLEAQLEAIDLGVLLRRLAVEYKPKADGLGLALRVASCELWARSDPALLERALRNLIENAFRYTPAGGVLIGLRRRRNRVRIDVVDTGIGVSEGKREDIFEEFVQLDNPGRQLGRGLGLGLAIVARVAKLIDATIELRSREGKGSRFSLTLPAADPAPAALDESAEDVEDPGGRILIVEDDSTVRDGLEALLTQWGYEAVTASCGEQAVDVAERDGWRFGCIVTDQRLGAGLTGVETAKEVLRRSGRALPTLVLTGDTAPENIAEIRASGFEVIHKPIASELLRRTLARMMGA